MLLAHFGLREDPFGVTPDPRFLFRTASHSEALGSMVRGIETGRGFITLLAEPGMGKTSLLHMLLEHLGQSARTAFVFQTQCTARELLGYLLADFEIRDASDIVTMNWRLNEALMAEARAGRRCVAVIDEAQNLSDEALEAVRLLSDFETARAKLLQIVLAGQPALADKLSSPQQEQLRQRLSSINWLQPLSPEEVPRYIRHRLQIAGCSRPTVFTDQAMQAIAECSSGVPRNVNNICFNAMSLCCAEREERVDLQIVDEVVSDLNLQRASRAPTPMRTEFAERNEYRPPESTESFPAQQRNANAFTPTGRVQQFPSPPQTGVSAAPSYAYSRESTAPAPKANSFADVKTAPRPVAIPRPRVKQTYPSQSRFGLKAAFAALLLLGPTALLISQFWPTGSANRDSLPPTNPPVSRDAAPIESTDSLAPAPSQSAKASAPEKPQVVQNSPSSDEPPLTSKPKAQEKPRSRQSSGDEEEGYSNVQPAKTKSPALTPAMGSFDPKSRNPEPVTPPSVTAQTAANDKAPAFLVTDSSKLPVLRVVPKPSRPTTSLQTGDGTHNPTRIVRPKYPDLAYRAKVHGDVEVEALVGEDGSVRDVTVIKGHPLLKSAAADAVRQWRYEPYRFNGRSVPFVVRVIISFKLQETSNM